MSDEYNRQFFFERPVEQLIALPKAKKIRKPLTVTGAAVIASMLSALVGGGIAVGGFYLATSPTPIVVNNTEDVNWVSAASVTALPSVVTINVNGKSSGGSGSGVFLTSDGFILTNAHVVSLEGDSSEPVIEVQTFDKRTYAAKLVGSDPLNDLAVIKIEGPLEFMAIEFADSSKINVGDPVLALGAPLGLAASVTSGVVSALNRTIAVKNSSEPSEGGSGLQLWNGTGSAPVSLRVIQTDAAINPGNSGGALVNSKGQLVGINVAIASTGSASEGQSGNIGVGFSIPSNVSKRIADEIMATGKASHGLLGALVTNQPFNAESTSSFSIGALIKEVTPGGPAALAGLKAGDVVTTFNGERILESGDLTAAVRWEAAETLVTLDFTRDGEDKTLTLRLGTLK